METMDEAAENVRKRGNAHFCAGEWQAAVDCYSLAMQTMWCEPDEQGSPPGGNAKEKRIGESAAPGTALLLPPKSAMTSWTGVRWVQI